MGQFISFGSLLVNSEHTSEGVIYSFEGVIDEQFDHKKVAIDRFQPIILNLSGIQKLNSIGVREWILLMRKISEQSQQTVTFRECSIELVDQINMIPEVLAEGVVESFQAPYFCDCGNETSKLLISDDVYINGCIKPPPEFDCECGSKLEFDAIEECYFQFLLPKNDMNQAS